MYSFEFANQSYRKPTGSVSIDLTVIFVSSFAEFVSLRELVELVSISGSVVVSDSVSFVEMKYACSIYPA